ncbi:MAG: dihydropteroate synthase [Desulforhopalus sp.]
MTEENRVRVMGILNVTPDSFSDGGQFSTYDTAVAQAEKLIADGADILDIGGESTRPFADPVSTEEELARVIPVIEAVRSNYSTPISIDTSKARVAREALKAGANIINDVWALRKDPEMIEVALESRVPVIIMHMKGTPSDMQIKPSYDDVVVEILDFFRERLDWITGRGVDTDRLIIDPGIGFGKNLQHNLSIIKHIDQFSLLGQPVLLGHSRKRFLGEITGMAEEIQRDLASAVVTGLCASKNIDIIRVHDVSATRQALKIAGAIGSAQ